MGLAGIFTAVLGMYAVMAVKPVQYVHIANILGAIEARLCLILLRLTGMGAAWPAELWKDTCNTTRSLSGTFLSLSPPCISRNSSPQDAEASTAKATCPTRAAGGL